MTIQETVERKLVEHGIWPKDVPDIMTRIKGHSLLQDMAQRWNDDVTGYPTQFLAVVWVSAKKITLEWIDENQPEAFYRQMFV